MYNKERLADNLCLRLTVRQRAFIEKYSEEKNVNVCEGARRLLDEVMNTAENRDKNFGVK